MKFSLHNNGFITHFLTTGKKESEFATNEQDSNQLRFEQKLRASAAQHTPFAPPALETLCPGKQSPLGQPWKYYYSHENVFLDDSSFYIELCRVELHAVTGLYAEQDTTVTLRLWSYAAADVWLNGELVCTIDKPVYKPVQHKDFQVQLKKGNNAVYIRLETMGVRDTHTACALQVLQGAEQVQVELPCQEGLQPYEAAAELLDSARLEQGTLLLKGTLPENSTIVYDTGTCDFRKWNEKFLSVDVSGKSSVELQRYAWLTLKIKVGETVMQRHLEQVELRVPNYLNTTQKNNRETVFAKIAEVASLIREETDGFALYPMLARRYLGQDTEADREELKVTLEQIERRMDCADFMTCALVRLMRAYGVPEEIKPEIRRVMLNFRYWMDEPGQDCMCFWSENHTLMFYQTAYFFGEEYPDDIFVRSGKTGREMRQEARERLKEWFADVNETGFDEFNSGVYSPITFAVMLNIVDYAEKELADAAWKACDQLLRCMCRHYFKGIVVSPQGRVYRGVLYPWAESLQSLVQLVRPEAPYVYSEWLIALATSRYQLPEKMQEWMDETGDAQYSSGNAVIDLYKTGEYMLTSVRSPRRDGVERVWQREEREEMSKHFSYVKSLNERFHGTTQIQPGVLGYQQHLWYAALDTDLIVFANHPGQSCEALTEVRPGYWFGNGTMPALRQEKQVLGAVYSIPDSDPIHFTHLYWNSRKFEQIAENGNWLFGKKGDSYIGVWCSLPLVDHDDIVFGCEKRAYGSQCAYLVVCASKQEMGSFEDFCTKTQNREVRFDTESNTLCCDEFKLVFVPHSNPTQILE